MTLTESFYDFKGKNCSTKYNQHREARLKNAKIESTLVFWKMRLKIKNKSDG